MDILGIIILVHIGLHFFERGQTADTFNVPSILYMYYTTLYDKLFASKHFHFYATRQSILCSDSMTSALADTIN